MKDKGYTWILNFIVFGIISTIFVQVYWNYKNYTSNRQQFINDVQLSLDNALEIYYANLVANSAFENAIAKVSSSIDSSYQNNTDNILKKKVLINNKSKHNQVNLIERKQADIEKKPDSLVKIVYSNKINTKDEVNKFFINNNGIADPYIDPIKALTSKVLVAITRDTLELSVLDSILSRELVRKNLNIKYNLFYKRLNENNQSIDSSFQSLKSNYGFTSDNSLQTYSKSSFLPINSSLSIHFNNEVKAILMRIISGILVSSLLVLLIISLLIYLLKIIKRQKKIAEVRNDFISNITHEFKTPIATVAAALESISDFNVIDNKEKTKSYVEMSKKQLVKLNLMVEKLLETATLDSEKLKLNKQNSNITKSIKNLIGKYEMQLDSKKINYSIPTEDIFAYVDAFHLENALNNVVDNAIKYGGTDIFIKLNNTDSSVVILISDNGGFIDKSNKDKIFEKFFRIPKGNMHNIKGYGIGLYYTKQIIEKHGGFIQLNPDKDLTEFKIMIPK